MDEQKRRLGVSDDDEAIARLIKEAATAKSPVLAAALMLAAGVRNCRCERCGKKLPDFSDARYCSFECERFSYHPMYHGGL